MSFLKIESYQKGIAISSFFNIIAKIILFVNSIVIAYYFGTQTKTDIYFYVMSSIIGLIVTLISGLNLAVLLPESMRLREQESEEKSMQFLNFFLYLYLIIGLIVSIPLIIDSVGFFNIFTKFGIEALSQNQSLLLLFIPLFTLILIVNYLTDILTSYKYFTMPMIAAIINNSAALIFIILFHSIWDVKSILVGLNTAYLINTIFLIYLIHKNLKWNFTYKKIKFTKAVKKNIIYAQAGNLASVLGSFAPAYILSSFGSGVITALNFGQKTANIPNDFITSQFTSISGIRYNELYAQKDYTRLNMVFLETAKFLIFIMIPVSVLAFIFSDEVISILFQRGKFDAISVKNSALFMKYLVLLLPFYAINGLASRLYMAAQLINYSFWYQIAANLMLIALVWFGIKNFGAIGFPYALLTQYILNTFVIYFFLKFLLPFIKFCKVVT
jgi:peptidoglycan biosynthesis protein MviN/MurJ (putative lipid II flippase)